MSDLILVVHVLAAMGLIGLVLLQQGKGADVGAAFGSGASNTVFGSRGTSSFLSRGTAILAAVFFATSISMAYFLNQATGPVSIVEQVQTQQTEVENDIAVPSNFSIDNSSQPTALDQESNANRQNEMNPSQKTDVPVIPNAPVTQSTEKPVQ